MSIGYIYILSNPSMPGILKIGFTNRETVEQRVRELSSATAVPEPFEVEYYCLTHDVEEIEKKIHQEFSAERSPGKEFFKVSIWEAVTKTDLFIRTVKNRFEKPHPPPPPEPPKRIELDPSQYIEMSDGSWRKRGYKAY